ncbi:hypothetical protein GCM10027299_12940 [Larkinella ripae]
MTYTLEEPEAEVGINQYFAVAKGFESEFSFSGQAGHFLQIRLLTEDGFYNPYGISNFLTQNSFNIGHSITKLVQESSLPSLFDGQKHTVKIQIQNQNEVGLVTKIFVDNMNQAAFIGEDTLAFDRDELFTSGPLAKRRVSLLFFGNFNQGDITVYNWSFKPL